PMAARATLEDDARKAAAVQARAAGVVGALAQSRAALLGDAHASASHVSASGAVARDAGDHASSTGASTASAADTRDGASSGSGATSGSGASSGSGARTSGASDGSGSSDGTGSSDRTGSSGGTGSSDGPGTLSGDEIGDAYGVGGAALSGVGKGRDGAGDGAIALGSIGTIGYGDGSATGYGYGGGAAGDLVGHRAIAPVCTFGHAEVRGSCDADLVRRVVRAHANEVRFCYEKVLQSRPTLMGRSLARFLIGVDGRVSASSAAGLAEVDACLAAAIRRWQFAPRCAAAVSYPFTFVRADGAIVNAP
ncbi:MAG: AgmX/PglI C-terminal domain-containing protein, partial [Myxococcales bacterium]|nr:AgmX/PglI C-terminal domain-containing protein [Myxococcales bacterium]